MKVSEHSDKRARLRTPKARGVHYDRSLARRKAMQLVYQAQILGCDLQAVLESVPLIEEMGTPPEYAIQLLTGLTRHLEQIDELLSQASANWSVDRMPLVDRCILRLAVYEMLYEDSVPVSVSINEAIELARDFGGEDSSSSFVNGVLGNIARASSSDASLLDVLAADADLPEAPPLNMPLQDEPLHNIALQEIP